MKKNEWIKPLALDEGVFSRLKKLIKLHQGLAKKRKVKKLAFQWIYGKYQLSLC